MARPDFLSPLILHAPLADFTPSAIEQSPNPQLILNPNKSAMLIDQFRFSGGTPGNSILPGDWPFMHLLVDLKLGSIPLTNALVPICALAPRYHGFQSTVGSQVLFDFNGAETIVTWHLPRPLYVPPGVQLSAKFQRKSGFSDGYPLLTTFDNMGFTIAGRSMPADYPIPKKIWVPWAGATTCRTAVSRFVSTDQELGNPNEEQLHVTQFVGFNSTRHPVLRPTLSPLTVQMTLSSNKMLMRDPVNFFNLFPADRGVLNVDAVLQPKEFVRAEFEIIPPAGVGVVESEIQFTTVGMIGYREVQTPIGVQP